MQLGFSASNNETKYEVLIIELELVVAFFVEWLVINNNSLLIVNQV